MPSDDERVTRAAALLGHGFRDRGLLLRALTHRSFAHEAAHGHLGPLEHNERLELLGDAVLSLVATEALLVDSPAADEGELSRRRAAYVSEPHLARAAAEHGVGELVRLGVGHEREGGGLLPALLADTLEALIGAAYLDGGLEVARAVVVRLLGAVPAHDVERAVDPKTVLQERMQAKHARAPAYRVVREGGLDHAPRFVAEVWLDEQRLGRGEGPNKREATRAAAKDALSRLAGET